MLHFVNLHLYESISLKRALHTTALITTILFTIPIALHFNIQFWGWISNLEKHLGLWDLLAEN
jgi:hypothetical protein